MNERIKLDRDTDRLIDLHDTEIDLEAWRIRNVTQMQRAKREIGTWQQWALIGVVAVILALVEMLTR